MAASVVAPTAWWLGMWPLRQPSAARLPWSGGDGITVDAHQRLIQLNVDAAELERRRGAWQKAEPRYRHGVLGKYARLVSSSSKGAVTDF